MNKNMQDCKEITKHYKSLFDSKPHPFHVSASSDTKDWVKIPVRLDRLNAKVLPLVIAMSEIFRLEIGITQPEYKLTEGFILSKKVKQISNHNSNKTLTLLSEWKNLIGTKKIFWEGMGRAVLTKYLFQENDFNINNAVIDENNYFVAIDNDKCMWELTEKYHYFRDVKIVTYNHNTLPVIPCKTPAGRPIFMLKDKKRGFIGDLHKEDYENLPILMHQYPSDWFFHLTELQSYSTTLSKDIRFLNEKHFATLKALVTPLLKNILIAIHVNDEEDKAHALTLLANRLDKLIDICKQSHAFKNYLTLHGRAAMLTIFYEIHQFLDTNTHYHLTDNVIYVDIQKKLYASVVESYKELLSQLKLEEMSLEDEDILMQHTKQIIIDSRITAVCARDFYQSQLMDYHATRAQTALNA